jgi:hypothetical protein
MTTNPGFSSRSSVHVVKQFPHRDEAAMSEHEPEPGFSNSDAAEGAAEDVAPEVQVPDQPEPGFSNGMAVQSDDAPPEPEEKAADDEPKPAKKSAAKKKG